MARMWKWDINVNLIGGGKHWDPAWPGTGGDVDFYHVNLAQNLMINLMSGYVFGVYYQDSIAVSAGKLARELETVPVDDADPQRLNAFHTADLDFFAQRLGEIQQLPVAATHSMGALYTEDTTSGPLKEVVDLYEAVQQHLRWICVPFVTLRQDLTRGVPGLGRPSATDLDIHIKGNTHTSPMGGMDYQSFLVMNIAYAPNLAARQHAFRTRWFDPLNATDRAAGQAPAGVVTSGKGNRLKCAITPEGVRYCATSTDPADYCAGGGTICAT